MKNEKLQNEFGNIIFQLIYFHFHYWSYFDTLCLGLTLKNLKELIHSIFALSFVTIYQISANIAVRPCPLARPSPSGFRTFFMKNNRQCLALSNYYGSHCPASASVANRSKSINNCLILKFKNYGNDSKTKRNI